MDYDCNNFKQTSINENLVNKYNINKNFKNLIIDNKIDTNINNLNFTNKSKQYFELKIGLNNLVNTCYLNSGLQLLLHCEDFINAFVEIKNFKNKPITKVLINLYKQVKDMNNIIIYYSNDNNFKIYENSLSPV